MTEAYKFTNVQSGDWHYSFDEDDGGVYDPLQSHRETVTLVEQTAQPTDSYVQEVPDHCDRIVWRTSCYHLPLKRHEIEARTAQHEHDPEWYHFIRFGEDCFVPYKAQAPSNATPLYTSPPASKPLTEDEIKEGRTSRWNYEPDEQPEPWAFRMGVKWAEEKHGIKEKNNG